MTRRVIKRFMLLLLTVLFIIDAGRVEAQGRGGYKIVLDPASATVRAGSQVAFSARLLDRYGTEVDTVFSWSVDATGFGSIDASGIFTAIERGHGFVYASAGDVVGKAHVSVTDTSSCDSSLWSGSHLVIIPADTLLMTGETLQYRVSLVDSSGTSTDTTATWQLRGNTVGQLTEEALFTAEDRGVGLVRATLGRLSAVARVRVGTEADTASADSVHIRFRDRDGKQQGMLLRIRENDVLLIRGLPFPLNVLNGGELVFAPGSLAENIEIEISLSETAIVNNDSTVSYADQVLNGIAFHVLVDGVEVSPYYFDQPVQLVLPYKEDAFEALGLNVDDLWMFFFEDAATYNGDGISNVVIDTVMNKIYADVIHFSDLVIGSRNLVTTAVDSDRVMVPRRHRVLGNYPNPFNPSTQINLELAGEKPVPVKLEVYNLLGQRVALLKEGLLGPGIHDVEWNGRDDSGQPASTGLYLCRFTAGETVITRRMLLVK